MRDRIVEALRQEGYHEYNIGKTPATGIRLIAYFEVVDGKNTYKQIEAIIEMSKDNIFTTRRRFLRHVTKFIESYPAPKFTIEVEPVF